MEKTATVVNTSFTDNAQYDDGDAVLYTILSTSAAWLRGTTFARNNAPQVVLSYSSTPIYSDTPLEYYSRFEVQYTAALGTPGAGSGFLAAQDAFFQNATAVRRCLVLHTFQFHQL